MSTIGTGIGASTPYNLYGSQSQTNAALGNLGTQSLLGTGGVSAQASNPLASQYGQMGSGGLGGGGGNILGMLVQIMSLMVSMLQMLLGGGMQGGQSPTGGSDGSGGGDGSQSGGCPGGGDPTGGTPTTPSPAPAPAPAPAPTPPPSGGGSTGGTQGTGGSSQPPPSGTQGQWIAEAQKALAASGVPMDKMNANDIAMIIQHESSGDPNAINLTDGNAQAGHPSIGLMQTIQPTFDDNKLPGHDNIRNPVDNIIAGVRYAVKTYGSVSNVPGVQKVKSGGQYVGY